METKFYRLSRSGAIFKAEIDEAADMINPYEWKNGDWSPSMRLIDYIIDGDPDLEDLPEADVPGEDVPDKGIPGGGTLVSKAIDERRFTLGPMYIPNRLDAHNEWTDPDELQKAVWDYMRKGDRRIRLQHNKDVVAGEALEVMAWPYEVEVPMVMKDASTQPVTFPANTVFLGVQWEPWAWELVKADKLRGYSIGGRAQRLLADLPEA
jgi:hypothetical protein